MWLPVKLTVAIETNPKTSHFDNCSNIGVALEANQITHIEFAFLHS